MLSAALIPAAALAQGRQEPGHPIGSVSIRGDLIVLTLNEGVLGKANLFDLAGRTLQFKPEGSGYRISSGPARFDNDFGGELTSSQVSLRNFTFPFSGKTWNSLSVNTTGTISFGIASGRGNGGRGGGVTIGRFDQLREAAHNLIDTVPAICVFFKPRMSGHRYFKELEDRAIVSWDLTEPYGNIQDFTWTPTVNRFQAVLHRDGSIEMSYGRIAARDAIVGVYPMLAGGAERSLATLDFGGKKVNIAAVDGVFLKVTLEPGAPVPAEDTPEAAAANYSLTLRSRKEQIVWTVRGFGRRGRGGAPRYIASGPGVFAPVERDSNSLSFRGVLPKGWTGDMTVSLDGKTSVRSVDLAGVRSPELDLSSLAPADGPFPVAYESFHYLALPNPRDLTCSVIKSLGDKFDFLAYYSDFRVDNQEAGTPSNGPLGGHVTGIGQVERGLDAYCSQGRFQWQFIQPVYVGSNQMQAYPPEGASSSNTHDIAHYIPQLSERSPGGRIGAYNYAMSQIGHEMGHRWAAFVSAKVNGETIVLGPTHWARGLQAPVAFPYQRPVEASAMGGSVWQDNFDGTYTQLDDDYYVPATGWSYLDLYLMGLIAPAEVPDFFILRNLVPAGRDANGRPVYKGDRVKVTIQDVIAAEGPRVPSVEKSQRQFNTGMVMVVEHGAKPSRELIERTSGIREKWIEYWGITTGHRAAMTAAAK